MIRERDVLGSELESAFLRDFFDWLPFTPLMVARSGSTISIRAIECLDGMYFFRSVLVVVF